MRDAADHLKHLLHRLRLSNQAILILLNCELRLECGGGPHLGLSIQGRVYHRFEIEWERFFPQVIESTEFH